MTPGTGRNSYDALVGPLTAGSHRLAIDRSPLWSWPTGLTVTGFHARIVNAQSDENTVLRFSPTLGVRADTIGTASDVPL